MSDDTRQRTAESTRSDHSAAFGPVERLWVAVVLTALAVVAIIIAAHAGAV